jgi:hypothetical protein
VKTYHTDKEENKNLLEEASAQYGNAEAQEEARLQKAINRTDMEKFRLFTRMLRINAMYKKAKITHKQ